MGVGPFSSPRIIGPGRPRGLIRQATRPNTRHQFCHGLSRRSISEKLRRHPIDETDLKPNPPSQRGLPGRVRVRRLTRSRLADDEVHAPGPVKPFQGKDLGLADGPGALPRTDCPVPALQGERRPVTSRRPRSSGQFRLENRADIKTRVGLVRSLAAPRVSCSPAGFRSRTPASPNPADRWAGPDQYWSEPTTSWPLRVARAW